MQLAVYVSLCLIAIAAAIKTPVLPLDFITKAIYTTGGIGEETIVKIQTIYQSTGSRRKRIDYRMPGLELIVDQTDITFCEDGFTRVMGWNAANPCTRDDQWLSNCKSSHLNITEPILTNDFARGTYLGLESLGDRKVEHWRTNATVSGLWPRWKQIKFNVDYMKEVSNVECHYYTNAALDQPVLSNCTTTVNFYNLSTLSKPSEQKVTYLSREFYDWKLAEPEDILFSTYDKCKKWPLPAAYDYSKFEAPRLTASTPFLDQMLKNNDLGCGEVQTRRYMQYTFVYSLVLLFALMYRNRFCRKKMDDLANELFPGNGSDVEPKLRTSGSVSSLRDR